MNMPGCPPGFGDFVEAIGADPTTELEVFCCLSEEEIKEALAELLIEGARPTPIQRAAVRRFVFSAFSKFGLSSAAPAAPAETAQPSAPPVSANTASPVVPDISAETVSLNHVVDQALKATTRMIGFEELAKLRVTYEVATGYAPPDEHLPSGEQLAGLKAILDSGRIPFVDFAIWNPHGARVAKFRRVEAAIIVGSEIVQRSVEGPNTVEAWEQSWALFSVAMISVGAATAGSLNLYAAGLRTLLRLFPGKWPILLTTDLIVRSERWGRIRELMERAPPPGYDPSKPWDAVIAASAYGQEGPNAVWWQTHFVLPASLGATSAAASSNIDRVEGNLQSAPPSGQPRLPRKRPQKDPYKGEVCQNFNRRAGACVGDGSCPAGRRHVCSVCGKHHRAIDFHDLPAPKGKGKGKKGKERKGEGSASSAAAA